VVHSGSRSLGPTGPVGKDRNPVMVLVLTMVTCGIYGIIQFWAMFHELKEFRQKDDFNPVMSFIFMFVPVLSLIEMWKMPERILDAKRMAGAANPGVAHPILYLFLSPYFMPADLNDVWQIARGGRPSSV
jgi:hypothetical protein